MSAENKALVVRWFEEVWNQRRAAAIDEMFAAGGVVHGLGPDMHGADGFKVFHATFLEAFPNLRVKIDDMIAEGDQVAYRLTADVVHGGGSLGFAATNRSARFTGMGIARIQDGKIVEGWNLLDQLGMLTQLGVVTLP
jgi:predicted ester cyclase